MEKLHAAGIHPQIVQVLRSWLSPRTASVIVNGSHSAQIQMRDMVYQGTVFAPPLWNLHFADAERAMFKSSFEHAVYADDLNAFKVEMSSKSDAHMFEDMRDCQRNLHVWGEANGVRFDPGKESMHILSRAHSAGPNFKVLGIDFDCKLLVDDTVRECATQAAWKLRTLLRTARFHTVTELVVLYKSHILSYVEYRTAAIAHAATTTLHTIDRVQDRFLREIGLPRRDALLYFRLAPLPVRRDIAILGVLHRCALGLGPVQLQALFQIDGEAAPARARRHRIHLRDISDVRWPDYALRSILGAVRLYNLLPDFVIAADSVKLFQRRLQQLVCCCARACDSWESLLSWRLPLAAHPLRSQRDWSGS